MRRKWWESPIKFICDHLWLLLFFIVLLLIIFITYQWWNPLLFPSPEPTSEPAVILGTGDVQVTLLWEDYNDIDLHVIDPSGEEIYYSHPTSVSGGQLDVDSNGGCGANVTNSPVENIFWPTEGGPDGEYSVYVEYYARCDEQKPSSEFEVRLNVSDEESIFHGKVDTVNERVFITSFNNSNPDFVLENQNTPSVVTETPLSTETQFDTAYLKERMLQLINEARIENGLGQVVGDEFSSQVAENHTYEMASEGYISHWNMSGYGPDIRYGLTGGEDFVQENVYLNHSFYESGGGVPVSDWDAEVVRAHESLMNSPGHRANILAPEHTHVGLSFSYNAQDGYFAVAQEFLNKYIEVLNNPSHTATRNENITFKGKLINSATNPGANLFYEPFPEPMDKETLMATESYISPAEFIEVIPVDMVSDVEFSLRARTGDLPGIYHLVIWVDVDGVSTQAIDLQVWVQD